MDTSITVEERVLRAHLCEGQFLNGVSRGRWRAIEINWPYAVFVIVASDDIEYGMRFECSGYPQQAVTGQPWDVVADVPLTPNHWPTGSNRIPLAFNVNWNGGVCLYLPCDRQAIVGHAAWCQQHPHLVWDSKVGIVHYLRIVHDLLNSGDYRGRRVA